MNLHIRARLYNLAIDPLLAGVRSSIMSKTAASAKVIDIACGTGTLAMDLAQNAAHVTAIDLDADFISYASGRAFRRGLTNIRFEATDASDLSAFSDNEFDIAITSMSVHQFDPVLALKILREMRRVAPKIIVADYNCPLPGNSSGRLAKIIEWMAGGDHFRNFRNYMDSGGLKHFSHKADLEIKSTNLRGSGVFEVTVYGYDHPEKIDDKHL